MMNNKPKKKRMREIAMPGAAMPAVSNAPPPTLRREPPSAVPSRMVQMMASRKLKR